MSAPNDNELQMLEDELRRPLSSLLIRPVISQDTARLLRILQPEFEQLRQISAKEQQEQQKAHAPAVPSLLRLARSQLSSYSKTFWIASLFVFLMLLIALPTQGDLTYAETLFSFVLPALLLASLAYSFRSWNKEMRMIETITPYPPALLLIVRTMIVISLTLFYGIAGSAYMTFKVASFPVLPFMLQWMSLLLLVSGIAAYALMWKGFKTAIACAGAFWICWNGFTSRIIPFGSFSYDKHTVELQIAAAAAGVLLLCLAYKRSFGSRLLP